MYMYDDIIGDNIKYFIRIFHPLRHIFEYFPDNEYFRIFNKFSVFDFNF